MSLDQLLKTYPETCIGCLGEEYNILLDDNATPVVHAPRRVPWFAWFAANMQQPNGLTPWWLFVEN